MVEDICLKTKRYNGGKRVIFTEKQRILKSEKHPELREPDFINRRIKNTIENPNFVYQDLAKPFNREALYITEFKINNIFRYTKVILEKREDYFFVITAFRPNYIKEKGKTKLIYGKEPI